MKILLFIVLGLLLTAILFFIALGVMSRSGNAPGLIDGKLSACPDKPNCVCSEFADDNSHYVSPLALNQATAEIAMSNLQALVSELGGEIQTTDQFYLAASFKSALFGLSTTWKSASILTAIPFICVRHRESGMAISAQTKNELIN